MFPYCENAQIHSMQLQCVSICNMTFYFLPPLATLTSSGLQFEFINPIFEFSKGMNDLHLDEAEYALLIAINIFSAGQNL